MSSLPKLPIDAVVENIIAARYHNHRRPQHSDILSNGIHADLLKMCPMYRADHEQKIIHKWLNVKTPGDRNRNIDLFIGESDPNAITKPQLNLVRLCIENKSIITAHRNTTNRFDDLTKVMGSLHAVRQQAIVVATVLVGICERVLNVPDRIAPMYREKKAKFQKTVLPRLSSGDASLFKEFSYAISTNTKNDVERTLRGLRALPVRQAAMTHEKAFDYVLLIPVRVDNVNPPEVARDNPFGIDVDKDYSEMLQTICAAYRARWHPLA